MSKKLRDIHGWLCSLTAPQKEQLIARLSSNVLVHGDRDDCITWQRSLNNCGYGQMTLRWGGVHYAVYVHALFWVLSNRRNVPEGLEIAHSCDVRSCVNNLHLVAETHAENMEKVHKQRRRT